MESLQVPEQPTTETHIPSESVDIVKKAKRVLSKKQREALKAGREKRWKRMFEALENQTEQQHKSNEESTHKDPLLEDNSSSSSSDSSESDVPPEPIKQQKKKNKLPKKIRKRVDKYIQEKLDESLLMDKPAPVPSYNTPYYPREEYNQPVLQYL